MVGMGSSVALFWAAITLIIPEIYLASKVVNNIGCERVRCSSPALCPPWHYCDMNHRFCEPCTQCTDGSDADHPRGTTMNCRDPVSCVETLYAKQDHACCKLRIADGYNCSAECVPCGGSIGSSLGTTCKAKCEDGAWEVFSCIFMNSKALWNVSRMPHWIDCEPAESPPLPPTTPSPTSHPTALSTVPSLLPLPYSKTMIKDVVIPHNSFVYHVDVLVGIVAGTVLGVSTIVVVAITLVVCVRRKEKPTKSSESKEPVSSLIERQMEEPLLTSDTALTPRLNKSAQEAVETSCTFFDSYPSVLPGENESPVESPRPRRIPQEHSCDEQPWNAGYETPTKEVMRPSRSIGESVVSLRSDRSTQIRQPQEHSPSPEHSRRLAGSSDSGHPPCRYSSSNSLHLHETMRKSVMDLPGRDFRGGPVEMSQETSSGFLPRYSLQDLFGRDRRDPVELSGGISSDFPPRDTLLQDIYRFSDATDGWSPFWPVNIGSPVEIHDTSE